MECGEWGEGGVEFVCGSGGGAGEKLKRHGILRCFLRGIFESKLTVALLRDRGGDKGREDE